MQKLTFTIDLTPIELRGMSATLSGMAAQIERNLGTADNVDALDEVDYPEFLGVFPFGDDCAPMDVFSNTPLLFEHINALPAEAFEKYEGERIEAEQTAAQAFGENEAAIEDVTLNDKTAPATDVDLDADGIPWDARIHAASKLKLKRGNTWKLKKGIDKDLVATVVAELKALMLVPAATTETTTASNVTDINTAAKPAGPAGPGPAKPAGPAAPSEPVAEVLYDSGDGHWTREQLIGAQYTNEQIDALPIVNAAPASIETTFPELMQLVTPALAAKTITNEQVTAACKKHGVESLNLIAARPDLIPAVKTELFG